MTPTKQRTSRRRLLLRATGLALALLLGCLTFEYHQTRAPILPYNDLTGTLKQAAQGREFAVVTGTPWATDAAVEVLKANGSACDAAVAALLVLNVTHGEAAAFGGVAPTLYFNHATQQVRSYIGVGTAPAKATISYFVEDGHTYIPSLNIAAQLIPAGMDVMTGLLTECGTMPFSQLAAPAIALAHQGFPMHAIMHRNLNLAWYERLGMRVIMPSTADVWLANGWLQPFRLHQKTTFSQLGDTLQRLAAVETAALQAGANAAEALTAIRDYFYNGPIAAQIADFHANSRGLIEKKDLSNYRGGWEQPLRAQLGAYTWFGNGTWSQSIMEPLILNILQHTRLAELEHNSPAYIHIVTQAIELAMSDRDTYIGDPDFVDVPLATLLSPQYAATRRRHMTEQAYNSPVQAGEIPGYGGTRTGGSVATGKGAGITARILQRLPFAVGQDTSQLAILDRQGNAVVITPSDFPKSPMLPGTGINLGDRMTQFRLDPSHVNALRPGKRPRITPHSVIVFKHNQFHLAFSTPGGDMQAQALVQVFLNMTLFDMSLQEAISAPRFYSINSPSSFSPHDATPGGIRLEQDVYNTAAKGLQQLGYDTLKDPQWDKDFGAVGAIMKAPDGTITAAADPREETTAHAQ